jgi:thiol-disulfide isomerase/thioredoxin
MRVSPYSMEGVIARLGLLVWTSVVLMTAAASPPELITLDDDSFEGIVFAPAAAPHFIFFYAPWCGHCKATKPLFTQAHELLLGSEELKHQCATLALVDATANKRLSTLYGVKSFPTFIYTLNGRAYMYHGGRQVHDFVQFASYLYRGFSYKSFNDDVSHPERFEAVDVEAPGRAAFVFYLPTTSGERGRELINRVAELSISVGKARFAVIHQQRVPSAVARDHFGFSAVMQSVRGAKTGEKGPFGVTVVAVNDQHRKPQLFSGEWLAGEGEDAPLQLPHQAPAEDYNISTAMFSWIQENALLAAEPISAESYAEFAKKGQILVVLVTRGGAGLKDTRRRPVLVDIVQSRSERQRDHVGAIDAAKLKKKIVVTSIDPVVYHEWCTQFEVPVEVLPTLVGVEALSDIVYFPPSELVAQLQRQPDWADWAVGGPEQHVIEEFIQQLEMGLLPPVYVSTVGKVSAFLRSLPLGLGSLHSFLGGDDTLLVTVLFVVVFGVFVMFLASRGSIDGDGGRRLKVD